MQLSPVRIVSYWDDVGMEVSFGNLSGLVDKEAVEVIALSSLMNAGTSESMNEDPSENPFSMNFKWTP